MAAQKTSKRGGARPGAGRPALFAESADLTVRFPRRHLERLAELAGDRDVSTAELVREAVATYLARRWKR